MVTKSHQLATKWSPSGNRLGTLLDSLGTLPDYLVTSPDHSGTQLDHLGTLPDHLGHYQKNYKEKVAKLYVQAQQCVRQIEALKKENVVLKKELEKNESALSAGFIEHKMLSERYNVLKSKFSRMQKVVEGGL